jgi:hypothetical protein
MTGRIFDRLEGHYGQGHVFMDIDNIPYGTDFRHHLQDTLDRCDILLVVVGPRWFGRNEADQPRLFEESDWVRLEVATALEKKIPVIPLLVEGARMPKPGDLPKDLEGFAYRQAAVLDVGVDFRVHMERLTKSMDRILALRKSSEPQAALENTVSVPKDETPAPTKLPEPQPEAQAVSEDGASVEEESSIAQASIHQADEASPPTAVAETGLAADHTEQANLAIEQPAPVENIKNETQTSEEGVGDRADETNRADEITQSAAVPTMGLNPETRVRVEAWGFIWVILVCLLAAGFVSALWPSAKPSTLAGTWCPSVTTFPLLRIEQTQDGLVSNGVPVTTDGYRVHIGKYDYYFNDVTQKMLGNGNLVSYSRC